MEMFARSFNRDTVFASVSSYSDDGRQSPEWFRWQVNVNAAESRAGLTLTKKVQHLMKLLCVDNKE